MTKRFVRTLFTGILVFAAAILAGCLAFVITYRYQTQPLPPAATAAARPVYSEEPAPCTYLVRLEEEKLCVYAKPEGREEYLYSLEVPLMDLPEEDREALERGILLPSKEALTALEEDYTG